MVALNTFIKVPYYTLGSGAYLCVADKLIGEHKRGVSSWWCAEPL